MTTRAEALTRLRSQHFDLAVIGAGINGAAIARDAAMRGLRVALFDQGDFAGATSSRSSKLIHGGFRYLPQGQIRLVYHGLRERERLRRRTAPHLVRPIRFLMPLYRGRGYSPLVLGAGLMAYDLFALTPRSEWHRTLSAAMVSGLEPALSPDGLRGGALYYDAWSDDARLTLENALDAGLHDAAVCNYVSLEGFGKQTNRLVSAQLRDRVGGSSFELSARCFINAAGPWVDDIRRMDDPDAKPCVRLTKGVHLVFPAGRLPVRGALVLSAAGGRIVFVMPHGNYVLVGTTDTDFTGERATVGTDRGDVEYLLGVLHENLPGIPLTAADVASSFAGLRALLLNDHAGASPSAVSREETILESASGLVTLAGGKLTTHREIAQKVVDKVAARLDRRAAKCPTLETSLPGARPDGDPAELNALPVDARELLSTRYGTRAVRVARLIREHPDLGKPLSDRCPALGAEVIHAIREELALTVADFLVRRTALVWRAPREAESAAPVVARLMAAELGWDQARERNELEGFVADLRARRGN